MMLSNVYADTARIGENHMRLMVEDSDKGVFEIWVYKDWNPVCRFSLEDNDRVIKEGAIDWNRARSLMSANRRFDIEYEYYELLDRLIATSIRFRDEKEEEENMARYAYRTFSMSRAMMCDWVNSKAEVSDKKGNTYSFDDSTDIYLQDGSTDQPKRITFARAANILFHNITDNIQIRAYIVTASGRITLMYICCDEAMNELEKLKEENERLRWDNANKKCILNSMYGVSALGWSDMWPTTMIRIPSRQNGKMARLKEFAKKCNLTVPECLYCMNDIAATKKIHDSEKEKEEMKFLVPKIKKVLYNEPAVIVFWEDDTKTVVRAQDGEPYDKEKGLAMAISKKALGNDRDYYGTFIRYKAVPKPKKGKKE